MKGAHGVQLTGGSGDPDNATHDSPVTKKDLGSLPATQGGWRSKVLDPAAAGTSPVVPVVPVPGAVHQQDDRDDDEGPDQRLNEEQAGERVPGEVRGDKDEEQQQERPREPAAPPRSRVAYADAHVVPDPYADPAGPAVLDWDATLRVRARRAATAAHYEDRSGTGIIAVPDLATADWAMRELVVLHEVAHHLGGAGAEGPAHGPEFVATMCTLTELVMGPELGHVLRVVYAKEGVR